MLQILLYGFVAGTQVLLMALALFLVYSVSKVQNLALGAIATTIAYSLFFTLNNISGISLWIALLISLFVAVILGVINFLLNESFTQKQQYLFALFVSLSFGVLLESLIAIFFGTGGKSFIQGVASIVEFGEFQIPIPAILTLAFGFCILIILFGLQFTVWGRTLKATAENRFSAEGLGMNTKKVRLFTYIVASIIVGIVGILVGFNTALVPSMGFSLIVLAFVAFLVGGVSDIKGTIIASYLIVLIPEFLTGIPGGVSSNWRMVLIFGVAFIALLLRPKGLFMTNQRES